MRHSGRDDAGPRIPRADRGPVAAAADSARRAAGPDTGRAAALALYRAADDHGREEDDGAPQVSHPLARQLRQYRQSAQCSGTRRSRSWCRDGALRWSRACGRDGTLWSLWRAAAPDPGSRARLSAAALFPAAAAARLVSAAAAAVGTVVAPVAAVLVVVRNCRERFTAPAAVKRCLWG